MATSYVELKQNQFLMTFSDLEGDKLFLKKSLALYKAEYQKIYPKLQLEVGDFSIVNEGTDDAYIQLPKNVVCIHNGDLTDKTKLGGSATAHNLELVRIMLNTHKHYAASSRMFSILGNRETTKTLRFQRELNSEWFNKVLEQKDARAKDAALPSQPKAQRPVDMVWVDANKTDFLTYLLTKNIQKNDFQSLPQNQQEIHYLKWMFANSCGAPDLWEDLREELGQKNPDRTISDETVLTEVKAFFVAKDGIYHQYMQYCQVGLQFGDTLFTHSGLSDQSFLLPKTFLAILDTSTIKHIFGNDARKQDLLDEPETVAENVTILLEVLNAGYRKIVNDILYKPNKTEEELAAIDTMIAMGLPNSVHGGCSVINVPCADATGFSNPISVNTVRKLSSTEASVPSVRRIAMGHIPMRTAQIVQRLIGDRFFTSIRLDTCNYRKGDAAVAFYMYRTANNLVSMGVRGIDDQGSVYVSAPAWTNLEGLPVYANTSKVKQKFVEEAGVFVGYTAWYNQQTYLVERYNEDTEMYTLFRLGLNFSVESPTLDAKATKSAVVRAISPESDEQENRILNGIFAPQTDNRAVITLLFKFVLNAQNLNFNAKILFGLTITAAIFTAALALISGAPPLLTVGMAGAVASVAVAGFFSCRAIDNSIPSGFQPTFS